MERKATLGIPEGSGKNGEKPRMSGFKILRLQGQIMVDIELTQEELDQAYTFEQRNCDYNDIVQTLEDMDGDDEMRGHIADEIIANEALMDIIVSTYESKKEDFKEWYDAAAAAIEQEIAAAEKTGLLTCSVPSQSEETNGGLK